jgi:hypothetical protein
LGLSFFAPLRIWLFEIFSLYVILCGRSLYKHGLRGSRSFAWFRMTMERVRC